MGNVSMVDYIHLTVTENVTERMDVMFSVKNVKVKIAYSDKMSTKINFLMMTLDGSLERKTTTQ